MMSSLSHVTNEHPQESDEEGEAPLKPDDIQAGLITPVEGGYAWGGMLGWTRRGGGTLASLASC